jgi:hypothetical protein
MVGGLATLAALTGTAGAAIGAGMSGGDADSERSRFIGALASGTEIANADPAQLAATCAAFLAVVHAQLRLDFRTAPPWCGWR